MFQVIRFRLDRGIDGFRVDVVYRVMKDPQLRDNPPSPDWHQGQDPGHRLIEKYNKNTPDSHLFSRWLRSVVAEYEDRVLIGEINLPLAELVSYYGRQDEFHLPQNINLHETRWQAGAIRQLADNYEQLLPKDAWPNWVLGNHDQHRLFTRVGMAQGRIALMLLLTLRGTPIIYYGDEIGMCDGDIPASKVQDPWEKQSSVLGLGRDPERTPMQWNSGVNAGFTAEQAEPWLPLAADYQKLNVEREKNQADSILCLVKELISLRRDAPALHLGTYESFDAPDGLFVFGRQHEADRFLILLNFSNETVQWRLPAGSQKGRVRLNTYLDQADRTMISKDVAVRAHEGILIQLSA